MQRFIGAMLLAIMVITANAHSLEKPLQKPLVITHKLPEFGDLKRKTFDRQIIQLALEKTQGKTGAFEMVPINIISRTHAITALNQNRYENFVMALSYEDILLEEGNLIYIPFPVELGALSYRICYANERLKDSIKNIDQLEQLKPHKLGVGEGWLDAKIMQQAGLQIVTGSNITSLFRMTQAGRADIFCPSPTEYFHELAVEKQTDLQLDNKLALYYPLPKFLFAHKNNQALLDRIQQGIEIAYKDGSYIKLWRSVYVRDLKRAKLNERHLIKLDNPFISTLPDDYKQYLFDPLNL
tara:strand:+ start:82 stop:972 length:891 start_codon:yes stop_codon:yes gene_type:complete